MEHRRAKLSIEGRRLLIERIRFGGPAGGDETVVEHDPPRVPISYASIGALLVLSGVTSESATLAEQIDATPGRIAADLRAAGAGWHEVVQLGCFLRADQDATVAGSTVAAAAPGLGCPVRVTPVGGFSTPAKLVELEVTALRWGD